MARADPPALPDQQRLSRLVFDLELAVLLDEGVKGSVSRAQVQKARARTAMTVAE
jgi:hypothetical protein